MLHGWSGPLAARLDVVPELRTVGHVQLGARNGLAGPQLAHHRRNAELAQDLGAGEDVGGAHDGVAQARFPCHPFGHQLTEVLRQRILVVRPLGVQLVHRVIGAADGLAVVGKHAGRAHVHVALEPVGVGAAGARHLQVDRGVELEVGADQVRRVDHRVDALYETGHVRRIGQVASNQLQVQARHPVGERIVRQQRPAHLVVARQQLASQPASHLTGNLP